MWNFQNRTNTMDMDSMDIVIEPEIYTPNINEHGEYVDIPIRLPMICLCGTRKDKVYTVSNFKKHTHTITHQAWLQKLNAEKFNYYLTSRQLSETVEQQKHILTRLENEIQRNNHHIHYLEGKIKELTTPVMTNLLD